MPYIHFTDEQKRQANLVDLTEFLRRRGEPLIQSGRELRMGSNHSVTVRGNEWYDHAAEKGGGPVSFLKEFYGMDYQQAVLTLLESDGGQLPQIRAPNEKVKKPFELPQANGDNRRMFAYLVKHRCLDRDVVAQFIRQRLLYEDQKYHNVVFVGRDADGTARWATVKEIAKTFSRVPFKPAEWRQGKNLPKEQGLVLGSQGEKGKIVALVDSNDVHCLMIGASGVGKTAFFLYPNLEYACACGMSFLALDTKGDLARNYGTVAQKYYGYQVSVIDLRNPTRSDGFNFLTLVNHYMDESARHPDDLAVRAKAEKYAKILSKTIISPEGDSGSHGQNAYFYDSAEGLLTAVILLLAEFLPPKEINGELRERRHIVSVFKLVQDLLEPSKVKGKSQFQVLMSRLPSEHKAKWFAGAALNTSEQAMASVLSTVLSRLNAFLDTELEQTICFDSAMDAESFASRKSAIFLILPEEDQTKNFMAGLMVQNVRFVP